MQQFIVNGVDVTFQNLTDATKKEAENYVDYVCSHVDYPDDLTSIDVYKEKENNNKVNLQYTLQGEKFERIRRITGYLVGSLERWNDSKQAEERDRVKHDKF